MFLLKEKTISKKDALSLLDFVHKSFSCANDADLRELILHLRHLIPFEFAICVLGKKGHDKEIKSFEAVNVSYPNEWLELYITRKFNTIDPIIEKNFDKFGLQYWADTYREYNPPKEFLCLADDFGLKNGYTCGTSNFAGTVGSLFSISGRDIEHNERTEFILKITSPLFYQALVRLLNVNKSKKDFRLTSREKEILKWLGSGKSTWDISVILGLSEGTIKYHIKNIMRKLDAVSRAQAVAIAIENEMIDIE